MTRSTRTLILAAAAAAAVLPAASASGQASASSGAAADSLPFRPGQWGAEFTIADGVTGVGALRFRSPRTAWVLDGSFAATTQRSESEGGAPSDDRSANLRLRAGPRRYSPLARGAAAYVGTGLAAGYGWSDTESPSSTYRTWNAGIFADIGAVYLVTSRLGLGAQLSVTAGYSSTSRDAEVPGADFGDRRFSIGTTPVRIVGALYF